MPAAIEADAELVAPDGRTTVNYSVEDKAKAKQAICDGLAEGTPFEELRRELVGIPTSGTLCKWKKEDEEFRKDFAHARKAGYDVIASDCLRIADDGSNDWMDSNDEDNPGYKLNGEHIQRSKLRVDTRLKLLSKWDSSRYGERVQVDADKPLVAVQIISACLTPAQAAEAYRNMLELPEG